MTHPGPKEVASAGIRADGCAITFGSLFAGIGGFDLGLERAGMVCEWQVEIDSKCLEVLAHHWPDTDRSVTDVREFRSAEPVDLICGGFPCQDLSVAGKREGLAGERSGLWFQFHRILEELAPRWVVVENVPGLLSSNGGQDFAVLLRGLVQLGYGVAWRVLDAQYFGVAQRRRRVFIVGHLGDGRAAEVLFESKGSAWDSAPSREAGQEVAAPIKASSPSRRSGGSDPIAGEFVAHTLRGGKTGWCGSEDGTGRGTPIVATALTNHHQRLDPTEETFVTAALTQSLGSGGVDDNRAQAGHLVTAFDWQSGGDVRLSISEKHTSALQASQTPAVAYRVHAAESCAKKDHAVETDYARCLDQTGGFASSQGGTVVSNDRAHSRQIAGQFGVRRLTPRECERLQGFPDDHTAVNGMSDSARYRMLGNAVAVPCAEWIGQRIVEVERREGQ